MSEPEQIQSALQMLNKIGPTLKSELVNLVPQLNSKDITTLLNIGFVKPHLGDKDIIEITKAGERKIGIFEKSYSKPRQVVTTDEYNGADLRPFDARPGCNQSLSLPSRHCDELRFRDGRMEKV